MTLVFAKSDEFIKINCNKQLTKKNDEMNEEIGNDLKHPDAYKRFQGKQRKTQKIKNLQYSKNNTTISSLRRDFT